MKLTHAIVTGLLVLSALSCFAEDEAKSQATLAYTRISPAKGDRQRLIHEDDIVKMVAVGYGNSDHPGKPGFYVFLKKTKDWMRIDRVPTRGATFGRSPTFEEVNAAGKRPASIGWDFRGLSEIPEVEFPLKSAGFLFFPDKVECDEKKKEYVLHFNSSWEIKGVETILRLQIDQLTETEIEQEGADRKPPSAAQPPH